MRERICGAGLVLAAALASAAPASAAGRADMKVARAAAEDVHFSCDASGCSVRLRASARVINDGAKRARRARLGFFLSQNGQRVAIGRKWVPAIGAGQRRRLHAMLFAGGLAPGTYRLIACADVTRRVRERSDANNCRAGGAFTIQGGAGQTQPQPQTSAACAEPGWRSDLCAEIDLAMANDSFGDMADALTFALLYQHYRTGQAILPSVAASVIEPYRTAWDPVRGQAGVVTYRIAGFLDFWVNGSYAGVEWWRITDGLDTPEEFLSWWQTYGIAQFTARQNAINHSLNGIVQSEAAWRNAMDDWKAYDLRLVTAQQHSDATVFAHRTLEDAQTAVMRAENAIKP
jgi:CARDB